MGWLWLALAGVCEMVWPIGFKYSSGFTRLWPTAGTFACMIISFGMLALATRGPQGIPVGTAYAVWTGLGAAGTAVLGIYLFNEPKDAARLVCLGLIVTGVVGLKVFSPTTTDRQTLAGPVPAEEAKGHKMAE